MHQSGNSKKPHLDVGVTGIGCPELSGASLLFPVFVELRPPQDGLRDPLVLQGEGWLVGQPLFVFASDRQHDRYGLIGDLNRNKTRISWLLISL